MKASKMLIATLKEAPNEAQISSHILLIRAGMIRKLVAGVYNYLPLGLRVLNKVEAVIREEMDNSGALEILSSAIQPKELWEESGRWSKCIWKQEKKNCWKFAIFAPILKRMMVLSVRLMV